MPVNCVKCKVNITNNRGSYGIKCDVCKVIMHSRCVNVPDDLVKRVQDGVAFWKCDGCKNIEQPTIIVDETSECDLNTSSLPDIMRILIDLRGRMINVENSLQFSSQKLDELSNRITTMTNENKVLKIKLEAVESKLLNNEFKINKIEADLDMKNRENLQKNLVVFGLPDVTTNCEETVNSIFHALDVRISDGDILSVKPIKLSTSTGNVNVRKPLVLIKVRNIEIKDVILKKFRTKKCLRVSDLDLPPSNHNQEQRIVISHHLTSLQTKIYAEAKKFKLKHNFQYLWVQENNILLRKQSDTKIYRLDSLNDINFLRRLCEGSTNSS